MQSASEINRNLTAAGKSNTNKERTISGWKLSNNKNKLMLRDKEYQSINIKMQDSIFIGSGAVKNSNG